MSIWASDLHIGRFSDAEDPAGIVATYRGSHIYPTDLASSAYLGTAHIPGHITPDGRDDGASDTPRPWLRLSIGDGAFDATVLLDRRAATSLRDHLTTLLTAMDEGWQQ